MPNGRVKLYLAFALVAIVAVVAIFVGFVTNDTAPTKQVVSAAPKSYATQWKQFVRFATPSAPEVEDPPAPAPEPDPIVPGSANDPWGPILCEGTSHPAHHKPCPSPQSRTTRGTGSGSTRSSEGGGAGGGWAEVRQCESGGNYGMDSGNGFHGAYQFMQSTWNSIARDVGRDDLVGVNPANASPGDQDAMAAALLARSGKGQWPVCGRNL